MKTLKITLSIAALAASFFACNTSQNGYVTKTNKLEHNLPYFASSYGEKNTQKVEIEAPQVESEPLVVSTKPVEAKPAVKVREDLPPADAISNSNTISSKTYTRAEKKEVRKELRNTIKRINTENKSDSTHNEGGVYLLLLVIIAILLPPLAVFLHEGALNTKFWLSLLLTLLFFIPGIIYALVVILGADD